METDAPTENKPSEKRHVFDEPKNVKRLIGAFFALCALVLCLDLIIHRHPSFSEAFFSAESWFGFYAFYGFVACVLLVLVAKEMRKVLMRGEDYYER